MKVLFAVSNENISESIVKKYQKDYKEIISYKNVYYFNAILKEIQRDKTYDRIVISEDLEPFANNDYEAIDRFIFDKLDSISDEATDSEGGDTPIILICSDRRAKSEQILVKLFSIGVYSALLGQDRSIEEVCKLIRKPRTKKEAKIYYKIDSEDAKYQEENEDTVSEIEIQNIRAHYKRLGKNEDEYVNSFNNIAAQYTDAQLRIIVKFLPLNVKAVLETKSPKYQSIMSFAGVTARSAIKEEKKESALKIDFIENQTNKPKMTKPVIVPSGVNTKNVTKLNKQETEPEKVQIQEKNTKKNVQDLELQDLLDDELLEEVPRAEEVQKEPKKEVENIEKLEQPMEEQPKRGRGRPKKVVPESEEAVNKVVTPKRGRGRPKKVVEKIEEPQEESINLFDLDDQEEDENVLPGFESKREESIEEKLDNLLPGFENEEVEPEIDNLLPGLDETTEEQDNVLPGFEEDEEVNNINLNSSQNGYDSYKPQDNNVNYDRDDIYGRTNTYSNEIMKQNNTYQNIDLESLLTRDKKIVSFVGTTKNGTSFLVNNLAELFASMGINTAILDATKNKNSYYIYTKNEEDLRRVALKCMNNLSMGQIGGIQVNKNLTVYTTLPTENETENYGEVLATLVKNYSLVLIDCDFDTNITYFENSQEIYLVQSMDILTIQPLTAFLRELKAKNILVQEKLRVVINKEARIRSLNPKVIIGGMAYYNDPAMSFMTELFNKDNVRYCTIPFDEQVYSKYLEGLVNCKISLNGYSKNFMTALKELGNMVYPLLSNKYRPVDNYARRGEFPSQMNTTLEQMKRNY